MPLAVLALSAAACGDGGGEEEVGPDVSPAPTALGDSATPVVNPDGSPADGDPTCTPQTYEVQSGDTLLGIALEFDVSVEAIAGASGVADPNVLEIGQELTIPCPGQLPATPSPGNGETQESPTPAA